MPLVGRIGPLARTFDFVADAAPGVKEILTVGKLCYEVRERHYDLVVVDAEATGHIVGPARRAPRSISELVQVGLVRDQTRWMIDILEDPAPDRASSIVTTPEEMPVTETLELVDRLGATETRVGLAAVVVNRVLPELFDRARGGGVRRPATPPVGRRGCWSTARRAAGACAHGARRRRAGRAPSGATRRRAPRPRCASGCPPACRMLLRARAVHPQPRHAGRRCQVADALAEELG